MHGGEFDIDELFEPALGWADVVEGDTVGGLARMKGELEAAGFDNDALFLGFALRFQYSVLQLQRPEMRREAMNRLLYGLLENDFPYYALAYFFAAQGLEEEGDLAEAARAYTLFIHHWEGADPELQPQVETARRALERIAGEGAG